MGERGLANWVSEDGNNFKLPFKYMGIIPQKLKICEA